jgi:NADP-dependent 3-hydroxy acid dehydrogenase YdfG
MNETRKSIFITGAASGIGRATAKLFAEKQWYVGGVDVDEQGLSTLAEELGAENCFTHPLDVVDRPAYQKVLNKFGQDTGGKLDLLFNNAGGGSFGYFDELSFESHLKTVHVNLIGVLNGIYTAIPMLKAADNSLCFTTSSSSATYGAPGTATYAATKHAVKGLTEALSVEFARFNVRAADVLPGVIDTPALADIYERIKNHGNVDMKKLPASAIAEAVWQAYHSDKLHWYVPESLAETEKAIAESPEAVRETYKSSIVLEILGNSDTPIATNKFMQADT